MNRFLKRLLCFWISILMVLPTLLMVSCYKKAGDVGVSDESGSENKESSNEKPNYYIKTKDLSKYYLVRSDTSSKEITQAAIKLNKSINEKLSINTKGIKTDFILEGNDSYKVEDYEILIGNTNREESLDFDKKIKYGEFGYAVYGKKIVILGSDDEKTLEALDIFIDDIVNKANEENFIGDTSEFLSKMEYKCENIVLNGTDISDYYLAFTTSQLINEREIVKEFEKVVGAADGSRLKKVTGPVGENSKYIVVSDAPSIVTDDLRAKKEELSKGVKNLDEKYFILSNDNIIWISGTCLASAVEAMNYVNNSIILSNQGIVNLKDGIFDVKNTDITVMSFNIFVTDPAPRRKAVVDTIKKYMPDTLGVQEASVQWMGYLKHDLNDVYDCVGIGRDSSNNKIKPTASAGEHCAIFYKKDKFNLIESNTYWLSSTPDRYSYYGGTDYPRIMTYAILERKSDGYKFMHVNTHIDYKTKVTKKQVQKMIELINNTGFNGEIVVTGDFNCGVESDAYAYMKESGYFEAYEIANITSENTNTDKIDFCFYKGNSGLVESHFVAKDKYNAQFPSDHRPILSTFVPKIIK